MIIISNVRMNCLLKNPVYTRYTVYKRSVANYYTRFGMLKFENLTPHPPPTRNISPYHCLALLYSGRQTQGHIPLLQ